MVIVPSEAEQREGALCFLRNLKPKVPGMHLRGTSMEEIPLYIEKGYEFCTADMIEGGDELVAKYKLRPGMDVPEGSLLFNDLVIMYTHQKIRDAYAKELDEEQKRALTDENLFKEKVNAR